MDLRPISVAGTEETGARLVPTVPSAGYGAGVPIKKRRFPFIQPPSPPLPLKEVIDAKQIEVDGSSNTYGVSNPGVASEHPPSSDDKGPPSGLNLSEDIDLNKDDLMLPDNQENPIAVADSKNAEEKNGSPIERSTELFEGQGLSLPSNAMHVDQKEKPVEIKNVGLASKALGTIDLMLAPGGLHETEAIQVSNGRQTLPPGDVSGSDSSATPINVDRSTWDLNTMMDATGDSSHCTASYSDMTLAFRENDEKGSGQNCDTIEQRAVCGKSSCPHGCKEDHIEGYLDLGLQPLIPNSNPSCELPSESTICNPDGNLGTAVKFINKKESTVESEPADEPADFCDVKPGTRTEKCGSISSFPFGEHLGKSASIKVEPDCMNQQINPVNDTPNRQEEMQDFSKLLPNSAETMQLNGPMGVKSCQSASTSSKGCSDQHPIEKVHPLGASDSTVTYVVASGNDDVVVSTLMENLPPDAKDNTMENAGDCAYDGGKIEISGCEDSHSSDSKYESNEVPSAPADHAESSYQEDDDYEDGEVREQLVLGASRMGGADQVENASSAISVMECNAQSAYIEDVRIQLAGKEIENPVNGFNDATPADTHNIDKEHTQELFNERVSSNPGCPYDQGELVDGDLTKNVREEIICQLSQSRARNTRGGTLSASNERMHTDNALGMEEKWNLSKTGAPVNSKVSSGEDNKRRIINLSGLSSMLSPDKARFVSERSLPQRSFRKRLPDTALEADKPHLRGRASGDDVDEFPRGRNRYSHSRNSRSNVSRDRDIVSNRIVRHWDVKREFSPEFYNYTGDRHTTKCKYASDYQNNDVASGDGLSGGKFWSRGRLNDDEPNVCRQSSLRRSPCGRGGSHVPRNISPSRCIGRDEFDVVSLLNNRKYRRDLGCDNMGAVFVKCSQISCEDNHDGLARGVRKLHCFKNERVLGRFRSNSPVRRNRSPDQGSNRRRSPEGFEGHLELSQRRSQAVFRRDRMRSPDRGSFHHKITRRRQPPYFSQNSEDTIRIHSERDHEFLRSRFTNRSSPSRGTFSSRRYGVNTRDRPCDEYSKVHMRTGWSKDVSRDGESCKKGHGEDRGPRHFQSPYSESEESIIYNKDEATSPNHRASEDRSTNPESGNCRERSKNRSGCVQKTRKTEDREGYYRRRRLCEEFDDRQDKRKRYH
ncbi:hypothetical protein MLD38_008766 [Melastoma candidum]|uniref:Uncharacterized protein n=1 Tax=Melastoma candidum TaxID=119954 RepID=A0ACB9RV05_9MYRT|nr:hypothetical protein MLD38_008766 [Melastoma candidum]